MVLSAGSYRGTRRTGTERRYPHAVTADEGHRYARLSADAARVIAERTGVDRHDVVVVLGSGWTAAADALGRPVADFVVDELTGFRAPVAPGHLGRVRSYDVDGRQVLAFLGRTHLYEGHGAGAVAHAVRTAAAAGCCTAVLTSASGSLRGDWPAGTGVVLTDHLNLAAVSALSGPSFVDLTDVYSQQLRAIAQAADPGLVPGVYAMLAGPHYETQAEARMIRAFGADVIGMSTVIEAIAARAEGMEVLGLSVVTTVEIAGPPIDPYEVVATAERAAARLGGTIASVVRQLPVPPASPRTDPAHVPASPAA